MAPAAGRDHWRRQLHHGPPLPRGGCTISLTTCSFDTNRRESSVCVAALVVPAFLATLLGGLFLHLLVNLVHALVPRALTLLRRVLLLAAAVRQHGSPWLRTTVTQRRSSTAVRLRETCRSCNEAGV